jgi:hypothetical protein
MQMLFVEFKCCFCGESWIVSSDGSDITDVGLAGARSDWANHQFEHHVGGLSHG